MRIRTMTISRRVPILMFCAFVVDRLAISKPDLPERMCDRAVRMAARLAACMRAVCALAHTTQAVDAERCRPR